MSITRLQQHYREETVGRLMERFSYQSVMQVPRLSKITLRRDRMFEFMDRLVNVAIPRIRDFRGLSVKAFDGRGNYSMGLQEQIVFPEIDYDKIDTLRGLDITITTTARSNEEGQALLETFDFPFRK